MFGEQQLVQTVMSRAAIGEPCKRVWGGKLGQESSHKTLAMAIYG